MYDTFVKTLKEMGIVLPTWFFVIVLIFIVLIFIGRMFKKYIKPMILYMEDMNDKLEKTNDIDVLRKQQEEEIKRSIDKDEELRKEIKKLSSVVAETQTNIATFADNRVKDRAQSFQIQKELVDAQKQISDSVDSIEKKIDQMKVDTDIRFKMSEEKQDARVRAELKDKISHLYRVYRHRGEITQIELETLEELISTYYNHGGNGYIKSIVEPELYNLKIVDGFSSDNHGRYKENDDI